ncbi:hypothetical protein EGT36_28400 [Agrobacterium sp. FDAARGOS_525]|nr:hypothetical protein EGT36_28400 [Agrobacterium sp. FDAARGOS_525]
MTQSRRDNGQISELRASVLLPVFEHYASERRERGLNVEATVAADLLASICSHQNVKIALTAVSAWQSRVG